MSTSSRTDQSAINRLGIATKREETSRIHTSAIGAAESLRVVSFKAKGCACHSCRFYSKELYTSFCSLRAKKQVNPLAICCHWASRL
jgi:hypothetical protein